MALDKLRNHNTTPQNPHYAWLDRARGIFKSNASTADPAVLEGIIAEGKARLGQASGDDVVLRGYIHLTIAEAQMNLALELDDEKKALAMSKAGVENCKTAAKNATADTAGTVCAVVPRALTLLGGLHSAMPEARSAALEKLIKDSAKDLDAALVEQAVLREQAAAARGRALILAAGIEVLDTADRREALVETADMLLEAGNYAAQAGDTQLLQTVQRDLEMVEEAAADENCPAPMLPAYDAKVEGIDLLPVLADEENDEDEGEDHYAKRAPSGGGLRKVISTAGLVISLGMTALSGYSLIGRVAGMIDLGGNGTASEEAVDTRALTQEAINLQLTAIAQVQIPAVTPAAAATTGSTEASPPATADDGSSGGQRRTSYSLFDDFSSKAMGWEEYENGVTTLRVEDGAYRFQHRGKGGFEKVFWPVDFIPVEAQFDMRAQEGAQDGTFGVFCQFQDQNNYYYLEVDLLDRKYVIYQVADGVLIPLTAQNEVGQYWLDAVGLKPGVSDTNRFGVTCYPETITFFINGAWVDEVVVQQPVDTPGLGAFFVYAFDFAGDEGYTVWFDNVELWEPVQ